jgi:hypothetical protein
MIPEGSDSVPAEVSAIVISSVTSLNTEVEIVSKQDVNEVWGKVIGKANAMRGIEIYDSFMSARSPIWSKIVEQYFTSTNSTLSASECLNTVKEESNLEEGKSSIYRAALGSLKAEASGGTEGAFETLCKFAEKMKDEFNNLNAILDSASALCRADSSNVENGESLKCSDIPGATKVLEQLVNDKAAWVSEAGNSNLSRTSIVCAYFGTDMRTNSLQYPQGSVFDLHGKTKSKNTTADVSEFANFGIESANQLFNGRVDIYGVQVNVYTPMIGNIKQKNSNNIDASDKQLLTQYWTAFFETAFNSVPNISTTGCEGDEIFTGARQ